MILPQEAKGNFTPSPRKDKVASVSITEPSCIVQVTISCGTTLGIRCLKIRRDTRMPQASVAVINSCSRRERICPRTRRAIPGQPRIPRISIRYSMRSFGSTRIPSIAAPRMMIRGIEGIQ